MALVSSTVLKRSRRMICALTVTVSDARSAPPHCEALSMPSLATLVYIRDLPVAALQQSKNAGAPTVIVS